MDDRVTSDQQVYLEVIRVHMQLLGVQHAQFGIFGLDVVHVLHGPVQTVEDGCSVFCNQWVSDDGSGVVEVSKVTEIPLSPGVDDQTPEDTRKEVSLTGKDEENKCVCQAQK